MSFQITHKGRKQYINFSQTFSGQALFITEDAALAKKICAHKWFRDGRIKVSITDSESNTAEEPLKAAVTPEEKVYSILGRRMSSTPYASPSADISGSWGESDGTPSAHVIGDSTQNDAAKDVPEPQEEATGTAEEEETTSPIEDADQDIEEKTEATETASTYPASSVSSLIEAKEFFSVNFGVDRNIVKTKAAVAELCAQYNVTFENYPL
jgi:hypothetical protein